MPKSSASSSSLSPLPCPCCLSALAKPAGLSSPSAPAPCPAPSMASDTTISLALPLVAGHPTRVTSPCPPGLPSAKGAASLPLPAASTGRKAFALTLGSTSTSPQAPGLVQPPAPLCQSAPQRGRGLQKKKENPHKQMQHCITLPPPSTELWWEVLGTHSRLSVTFRDRNLSPVGTTCHAACAKRFRNFFKSRTETTEHEPPVLPLGHLLRINYLNAKAFRKVVMAASTRAHPSVALAPATPALAGPAHSRLHAPRHS